MSKIFLVLLILLQACSHKKFDENKNYDENLHQLDASQGFAFAHEGDKYYFASLEKKEADYICEYYVGFKNGKKTYFFPTSRFKELNDIYEKNIKIEERIAIAIKKFDEFNVNTEQKSCRYIRPVTAKSVLNDGLDIIVWSPLLMIFGPIMIVEGVTTAINKKITNFDELRIGMTPKEVQKVIGGTSVRARNDNGQEVHVVDRFDERLVMYFHERLLTAWVRGMKPRD